METRRKLAFVNASPILGETPGKYVIKSSFTGKEEFNVDRVIGVINDARRKINAKRCVIDSLSAPTASD